jgi:hypothetical protein
MPGLWKSEKVDFWGTDVLPFAPIEPTVKIHFWNIGLFQIATIPWKSWEERPGFPHYHSAILPGPDEEICKSQFFASPHIAAAVTIHF